LGGAAFGGIFKGGGAGRPNRRAFPGEGAHMNAQARSVIAWIIVGLIAGWIAGLISGANGGGTIEWLIAGLIGAVVGGFLDQQLKIDLRTGNRFLEQLVMSVIGAVVVIAIASLIL
jgi:uncharacterized membrane protein YeaQ/YmgE (transglycosylase-associated protein family)